MSFFLFRLPFRNSPLSPCFASLTTLCEESRAHRGASRLSRTAHDMLLEFSLASSHTVGARLPPPFLPGWLFRRDRDTNLCVIEVRVVVSPTVVFLPGDFFRLEHSSLLLPCLEPLLQIGRVIAAVENGCPQACHPIYLCNPDQISVFQRKQRVHQSIHGVDVRNRDRPWRNIQHFRQLFCQFLLRRPILALILRQPNICGILRKTQQKAQISCLDIQ